MLASKSWLIVLSAYGLNLKGIVYETEMHSGPSVGISTGECVDIPMLH